MATRLRPYINSSPPINPAFSADWEKTTNALRCTMEVSTGQTSSVAAFTALGTTVANDDVLWAQHIWGPLAAQTIAGTIKGQTLCREENAAVDARAQLRVLVVSSDGGTVRGVALEMSTDALSSEFATSHTNRKFPLAAISPATLASVNIQAGDYLVIEHGFRQHGTNSSGARVVPGNVGASDAPEDETTTSSGTNFIPWFEFSQDLMLYVPRGQTMMHDLGIAVG